ERVHRVTQAVRLRRAREDLPEGPAELLGEAGEPRRPADAGSRLAQHGTPEGRELKTREQGAEIPERLVKRGDLDAHRVPELRPQPVEHRVPQLVTQDVGALTRVHRDPPDRTVEEREPVPVVIRSEA